VSLVSRSLRSAAAVGLVALLASVAAAASVQARPVAAGSWRLDAKRLPPVLFSFVYTSPRRYRYRLTVYRTTRVVRFSLRDPGQPVVAHVKPLWTYLLLGNETLGGYHAPAYPGSSTPTGFGPF